MPGCCPLSRSKTIAIAPQTPPTQVLTYERYLTEGEVHGRYDIIEGVRHFMPNPTWRPQRISKNLTKLLDRYENAFHRGQVAYAPLDILIERNPLRTRQPDVLFISNARLAPRDAYDPSPFDVAPEVVIEILSPSETRRVRNDKLADYGSIGVQECWIVSPEAETVEVLRLSPAGDETVAVYSNRQTLQSIAFPDLVVSVAEIFAD